MKIIGDDLNKFNTSNTTTQLDNMCKSCSFFVIERNFEDEAQFLVFKSPLTWRCDEHFEVNPFDSNLDLISNSSFYIDEKYEDKIAERRRAFQNGKFTIQKSQ